MKEELVKTVVAELFETGKNSEVARDVMKALLLPASTEMGEWFADKVRLLRYSSSLKKGLEKVRKMHQDADVPFSPVPLKKLLPLLEGLALEEVGEGHDETLHDMWAALLASAASPQGETVRPGFISVLKQMSCDEAKLLAYIYEEEMRNAPFRADGSNAFRHHMLHILNMSKAFVEMLGCDAGDFRVCLDALEASKLVQGHLFVNRNENSPMSMLLSQEHATSFSLTDRGFQFVRSCQAPKKTSEEK